MSKLTKTELKTPDNVWKASAASLGWVQDHMMPVALGFGLVIVGLIFGVYYKETQKTKEAAAQHLYAELAGYYQQWELGVAKDSKVSGAETQNALSEMQATYQRLQSSFPNSQAYHLAELLEGRRLLAEGKVEEAIAKIESFKKSLPSSFAAFGNYPLASTYEEAKLWDKALQAYESVVSDEKNAFRKLAFLGKARSLRELGRAGEAIAVYDSYLREFPDTPEVSQVRGLKTLLDQSGSADKKTSE